MNDCESFARNTHKKWRLIIAFYYCCLKFIDNLRVLTRVHVAFLRISQFLVISLAVCLAEFQTTQYHHHFCFRIFNFLWTLSQHQPSAPSTPPLSSSLSHPLSASSDHHPLVYLSRQHSMWAHFDGVWPTNGWMAQWRCRSYTFDIWIENSTSPFLLHSFSCWTRDINIITLCHLWMNSILWERDSRAFIAFRKHCKQ